MPILDLQRRMAEAGRIRMGEKKSGEKFPRKLETFRFTSRKKDLIEACAEEWGGTVEPWESPNGSQWQVVTEAKEINIILLPAAMAFTQWRELWSGGGCQRRCDSVTETIGDQPCVCDPDPARRECKDTTRLSVMLPDIPGAGLWRLESHGYYAATELGGTLEVVSNLAPGMLARGTLSAEPRSAKRFKSDGTPVTNRYIVPVLDLPELRLKDRMLDTGDGVSVQIETRTGLTPVPELPAAPAMSVREQLEAVPVSKPRRSNAAAPLPATGVLLPGEEEEAAPAEEKKSPKRTAAQIRLYTVAKETWPDMNGDELAEVRHALIAHVTNGRTRSSLEATDPECGEAADLAVDLAGDGGVWELVARVPSGWELRRKAGASSNGDGGTAKARLTAVCADGRAKAGAVKRANRLTGHTGSFEDIDEPTAVAVLADLGVEV